MIFFLIYYLLHLFLNCHFLLSFSSSTPSFSVNYYCSHHLVLLFIVVHFSINVAFIKKSRLLQPKWRCPKELNNSIRYWFFLFVLWPGSFCCMFRLSKEKWGTMEAIGYLHLDLDLNINPSRSFYSCVCWNQ